MASVHSNIPAYERTKIDFPKQVNKTDRSYNPKMLDYNSRIEVVSDLNGIISSTPPNGYFMDTLKNRMDIYFSGNSGSLRSSESAKWIPDPNPSLQ